MFPPLVQFIALGKIRNQRRKLKRSFQEWALSAEGQSEREVILLIIPIIIKSCEREKKKNKNTSLKQFSVVLRERERKRECN